MRCIYSSKWIASYAGPFLRSAWLQYKQTDLDHDLNQPKFAVGKACRQDKAQAS